MGADGPLKSDTGRGHAASAAAAAAAAAGSGTVASAAPRNCAPFCLQ